MKNRPEQLLQKNRLKPVRQLRRLTLDSLSSLSGIPASTISLIENGRQAPTLATAASLAAAIGLPVEVLFPHAARKRGGRHAEAAAHATRAQR